MYPNRRKRSIVVLAVYLSCTLVASAQETTPKDSPAPQQTPGASTTTVSQDEHVGFNKSLLRTFVGDEYQLWTSPFRGSNYDSHTMRKYGLPFLLITGALIATDHKTADWLPNTQDQTVWSGRVSQMGASYSLAGFSVATY